jgi:hypothetical protein
VARRRLDEDVRSGVRKAYIDDRELSEADWTNLVFRIDRWRRSLVERDGAWVPINLLIGDPIEARPGPPPVSIEGPTTPVGPTLAATEAADTAAFQAVKSKQRKRPAQEEVHRRVLERYPPDGDVGNATPYAVHKKISGDGYNPSLESVQAYLVARRSITRD